MHIHNSFIHGRNDWISNRLKDSKLETKRNSGGYRQKLDLHHLCHKGKPCHKTLPIALTVIGKAMHFIGVKLFHSYQAVNYFSATLGFLLLIDDHLIKKKDVFVSADGERGGHDSFSSEFLFHEQHTTSIFSSGIYLHTNYSYAKHF